ncbi:MFS transporter [Natronomonas sp.]|uniref:MFS transporter n=1 Tax=Natronomonas sp. TaxID=2184060 RepID=UPI0026212729|nr:MFS transporter [Natronomonas sp.]
MNPQAATDRSRTEAAIAFGVYVVVLTAAYYYNLTFVQLGLTDIGVERVGLSPGALAAAMGTLAVATLSVTLVAGSLLDRLGPAVGVRFKFRVLFGVIAAQIAATRAVGAVDSPAGFIAWILAASVLLGTAIPFAFGLLSDLVVPEKRGYAAGAVTALAFSLAAVFPFRWTAGRFAPAAIAVLVPAGLLLGVLSTPGARPGRLAHRTRGDAAPGSGLSTTTTTTTATVVAGVVLLFGAFFVDSLGFVRIVEASRFVDASWQSPDAGTRGLIASVHVVGGLAAGVAYAKADHRWLFAAAFALFAAAQFLYAYDAVVGGPAVLATLLSLVYVLAVSCYTTVAFALWPDLATPGAVGRYTAVGIGVGGWLATFASTAVALASERSQLPLGGHLLVVAAVSVGFLCLTAWLLYGDRVAPEGSTPAEAR